MPLRESRGNMYSWITHEWNPVKGKCMHDCSYCYMKKWGEQKPVRLDEKELRCDLGSDKFIFVVSGSDLFAPNIPSEWIMKTILHCKRFDNTYLFQSKNPYGFWDFLQVQEFPVKTKLCTTLESNIWYYPEMGKTSHPEIRVSWMNRIMGLDKYITIEPIMDFDLNDFVSMIKYCNPIQVSIGADSGNNHLPEPSKEKILALIEALKKFTIIDQKRNLKRLL